MKIPQQNNWRDRPASEAQVRKIKYLCARHFPKTWNWETSIKDAIGIEIDSIDALPATKTQGFASDLITALIEELGE